MNQNMVYSVVVTQWSWGNGWHWYSPAPVVYFRNFLVFSSSFLSPTRKPMHDPGRNLYDVYFLLLVNAYLPSSRLTYQNKVLFAALYVV